MRSTHFFKEKKREKPTLNAEINLHYRTKLLRAPINLPLTRLEI